jgi:hypothetical protein
MPTDTNPNPRGENDLTNSQHNMHHPPDDDTLYTLGLALLELLDREIAIELEQGDNPSGLVLQGTLLRAFDAPPGTTTPSINLMIGAHSISIRPGPIHRIAYRHKPHLDSIHIHFHDNYSLHIKSIP